MVKRRKQTMKEGNSRRITTRRALRCVPQRKGIDHKLGRSFLQSVVSNVIAFRHHFLQIKKPKQGLSQLPAATCLPNDTAPQTFDQPSPLPFRSAVRESQNLTLRLRAPTEGQSSACSLGRPSSTSSSVGKKRFYKNEL